MMTLNIGRIQVALHGISAQTAEEATAGLEAELHRQLGMLPAYGLAGIDIGELSMSPVHSDVALDANALRGLIAERLADAIQTRMIASDMGR